MKPLFNLYAITLIIFTSACQLPTLHEEAENISCGQMIHLNEQGLLPPTIDEQLQLREDLYEIAFNTLNESRSDDSDINQTLAPCYY